MAEGSLLRRPSITIGDSSAAAGFYETAGKWLTPETLLAITEARLDYESLQQEKKERAEDVVYREDVLEQGKKEYFYDKLEEDKKFNYKKTKDTEARQDYIFEQSQKTAQDDFNRARETYTMAMEQAGNRPDLRREIYNKFGSRTFKIPYKDSNGIKSLKEIPVAPSTDLELAKSDEGDRLKFQLLKDSWDSGSMTRENKVANWPLLKNLASKSFISEDVSGYEDSYNRALMYEENQKTLDAILSQTLPAGMDAQKIRTSLLKDDKPVSSAELQILAGEISRQFANEKQASEYWASLVPTISVALGKAGLDASAPIINDLIRMKEMALNNLPEYFFGQADDDDKKSLFDKKAQESAMIMFNKDYELLTQSQKEQAEDEANVQLAGVGTLPGIDAEEVLVPRETRLGRAFLGPGFLSKAGMKKATPAELGYTDAGAFYEDQWQQAKMGETFGEGFTKKHFGNDKAKFMQWFTGERTMGALPTAVPSESEEVVTEKGRIPFLHLLKRGLKDPEKPYKTGADLKKKGLTVDPISNKVMKGESVKVRINKQSFTYAKRGIIAKDTWPFWERVTIQEAIMSLRK
tara:strand:+ start:1092 stop:2828 length:1737 start_codon:yes stop_codon:yes gene_type:complete